ncbi:hypothetical protein NKH57_17140 [Mesorhizobium sp. M1050]|uniref:hypothetical protein n=1 Tax=unclassified Mesorhizobium TaxID=325217 RepID=UPI0003CE5A1E|nr:hypothetical protein [Mesorhizobium sp. LNHC252B00]ESY66346.1 hypothetical protein X743_28400 [Mesorhizobium sp. LNHC252B00]
MSREAHMPNIGTAEWLIGAAKNNPEGLLLVAAGCALLMRRRGAWASGGFDHADETRGSKGQRSVHPTSSNTAGQGRRSKSTEDASETADNAREHASDLGGKVAATASAYTSFASEYVDEARRNVTETSERVARRAQSTFQETVNRVVEEQPLTLALLGLATGAAVAAAIRPTDFEKRTLGPAGEQLTDSAEKVGERLKESTVKARERLRTAAEERGLNADGLKDVVSEVAGEFGSTLSGEQQAGSAESPSATSGISRGQSAPGSMGRSTDKSANSDQSQRPGASRSGKSGQSSGKRGS